MIKIDALSVERALTAHPLLRAVLIKILVECAKMGIYIRYTSVKRSEDEQNKLYAIGRDGDTTRKKVTMAKGDQSYHVWGLAVDFCLLLNDGKEVSWSMIADTNKDGQKDWSQVVKIFKSNGFEWGGDFKRIKDYPHFQKTYSLSLEQLRTMKKLGCTDYEGYVNFKGIVT